MADVARTHMAKLSCGNWQRVSAELVDLEVLTNGVEFGYGAAREHICTRHGFSERVVETTFWEWHVFCVSCRYNSWHGVDAEKARADYERHEKLTGHRLRVGWDTFLGSIDDETGQGSLFVTEEVAERRKRSTAARTEAVKRHAAARSRKIRDETPAPAWKPSGTRPRVSFDDLVSRARKTRE